MSKLIRFPWTPLRALRTAALSFALVAAGCTGDQGPAGPQGERGDQGPQGTPGTSTTVDPALSTVDKAFAGIGGKTAIQNLQRFSLATTGQRMAPGEGYKPEDLILAHTNNETLVRYDISGDRISIRHDRTLKLFGIDTPQTYTELINGTLGYLDGNEHIFGIPGGNLLSDRTAAIRRQQRLLNPHLILKDVAATPTLAQAGGATVLDGSLHELLVVNDPVYPITLYVNAQTGKISKLVTLENNPLHRDVPVEVHYVGWEPTTGGPLFPKQVHIAVNGHLLLTETRTSVSVNGTLDASLFAFPQEASPTYVAADAERGRANHQFHMSFASIGIPLDGLQSFVEATELSTGVWFLTGGSHNSLAIEQENGIVIVEAPLYPERSAAIINWVTNEPSFDGKPITHVLATHHHDDHSSGLRAFVAVGAQVIVHEAIAPYYRQIFRNPSTITPDQLAQEPVAANIVTVPAGGSITLPDSTNAVGAYSLETTHAADMLLFYVPSAKVAFSSDLYNPGLPPVGIGPQELYRSITDTHSLDVDTVVGGHGGTISFTDFAAIANP